MSLTALEKTLNSWVSHVPVYCSPSLYLDNCPLVLPASHPITTETNMVLCSLSSCYIW